MFESSERTNIQFDLQVWFLSLTPLADNDPLTDGRKF